MKNIIIILLFAFIANSASAKKTENDTIVIKTKIYCDHCKECSSCQPQIEQELRFTKGVKMSKVNVENQTITVIYNADKTSPLAIKEAISNSGYDADEIKANPKAVAKLDGCCQMPTEN